jgi:hypothetical protein
MTVQTKIVLLLAAIVTVLVSGLILLKITQERRFEQISKAREAERNRNFDDFLKVRGDALKVIVEDSTAWNDMVRAVVKGDLEWTQRNISDETLATYKVNAVWIYRRDRTLFYSRNNRYAESLRALPLPEEAFAAMFSGGRVCHFFIQVPLGWMEIRGKTIHPSLDPLGETPPQGYFLPVNFGSMKTSVRCRSLPATTSISRPPAQMRGTNSPTPRTEV